MALLALWAKFWIMMLHTCRDISLIHRLVLAFDASVAVNLLALTYNFRQFHRQKSKDRKTARDCYDNPISHYVIQRYCYTCTVFEEKRPMITKQWDVAFLWINLEFSQLQMRQFTRIFSLYTSTKLIQQTYCSMRTT